MNVNKLIKFAARASHCLCVCVREGVLVVYTLLKRYYCLVLADTVKVTNFVAGNQNRAESNVQFTPC